MRRGAAINNASDNRYYVNLGFVPKAAFVSKVMRLSQKDSNSLSVNESVVSISEWPQHKLLSLLDMFKFYAQSMFTISEKLQRYIGEAVIFRGWRALSVP